MRGAAPSTPTYATRWVADRLGISTATLRTWHFRYGLAPTGRTAGGHRRYSGADVGRLEAMHRLIRSGVPAAEAARLSHADRPAATTVRGRDPVGGRPRGVPLAPRRARRLRAELGEAARALSGDPIEALLADALRTHGVVATWTDVLVPVLQGLGECFADGPGNIAAEHVLSERTRSALSGLVARRARYVTGPPVLLAAVDQEQHWLPLHALAAALAENRRPSVLLGAVPSAELHSAVATLRPAGAFVWARVRSGKRTAVRAVQGDGRTVVVGGPGWPADVPVGPATRVDSLGDALAALLAAPG